MKIQAVRGQSFGHVTPIILKYGSWELITKIVQNQKGSFELMNITDCFHKVLDVKRFDDEISNDSEIALLITGKDYYNRVKKFFGWNSVKSLFFKIDKQPITTDGKLANLSKILQQINSGE